MTEADDRPKYKSRKWLEEQYHSKMKTTYEMADEIGCSENTIRNWMVKYGIPRRNRSDRQIHHRKLPPKLIWKNDGYFQFQVWNKGDVKGVYVHQLCAIAWGMAEPEEVFSSDTHIHHKNGVKWYNVEDNLEKLSKSEHMKIHSSEQNRDSDGNFV